MNKGDKITAEAGSIVFIKGYMETVILIRKEENINTWRRSTSY